MPETDVVDRLTGIEPGSRLDAIRRARPQTRDNVQASYEALFSPADKGDVTAGERFALAVFVAGLHGAKEVRAFYAEGLAAAGVPSAFSAAVESEIAAGSAEGPKGHYPEGPLSAENTEPPAYLTGEASAAVLGSRLAAAFEHAHMLVYHPRDASRQALDALLAAGWTTTGIVTLSQIVAFLSFQLRVVAGLRLLAAAQAGHAAA